MNVLGGLNTKKDMLNNYDEKFLKLGKLFEVLHDVEFEDGLENKLKDIYEKHFKLTTEIEFLKNLRDELEQGKLGKVGSVFHSKSIHRYTKQINERYSDLLSCYYSLLTTKEKIKSFKAVLSLFNKELPNIEEEQELIFNYLKDLLGIEFEKVDISFSN